jgi:hypothetical protein
MAQTRRVMPIKLFLLKAIALIHISILQRLGLSMWERVSLELARMRSPVPVNLW